MTDITNGNKITFKNDQLLVPNNPIIPFIEGDGIGPDIWKASPISFLIKLYQKLILAIKRLYGRKFLQVKKQMISIIIGCQMKQLVLFKII